MNKVAINHNAQAMLVRGGQSPAEACLDAIDLKLPLRGHFKVEHWRDGKRIDERQFPNGITNEGKNSLLDIMFHGVTQITTWYLGLVNNASYSALAATDTYANINQVGNGWGEFASYTDPANSDSSSTRPAWTEGAAASQSITNSSVVVFDITGTGTVKGLFLAGGTNSQTKSDHTSGTANKLWATALFSGGDVPVLNGDQLKVTYTVSD